MRRLALLVILVASHALASPREPVRKPAPADLDADRLSYFVDAVIADKAGDYDRAISRYKSAAKGKDHAAIVYNIADLERRREDYADAIKGYEKYLALAPTAPDRAHVKRLIEQLAKTPFTLVVDGDDLDAVVFVDGKLLGPSPLVVPLAEGRHVVERIGPTTYFNDRFFAKPMRHRHATAHRAETGNVVMSTSSTYGGSWRDGEHTYRMNARFTLPPGRHDTYYGRPGRACSPVSFEVPSGDAVVYVFIEEPAEPKRGACIPIKVRAQKIQFPGAGK